MENARCEAIVHRRDTYRRTGRGSSGFSMHYERGQCQRKAGPTGFCTQHAKLHERWPSVVQRVKSPALSS